MLALGQLRERRQESEDPPVTPGLQEGPRVTWQGLSQAARVFQSRKVKGEDNNRTALLCPWLCPLESPREQEKGILLLSKGFFFSGESQSGWWENKSDWELVLGTCSGD